MIEGQHLFDQHALHRELECFAQLEEPVGRLGQGLWGLNAQNHATGVALVQQLGGLDLGDQGKAQMRGQWLALLEQEAFGQFDVVLMGEQLLAIPFGKRGCRAAVVGLCRGRLHHRALSDPRLCLGEPQAAGHGGCRLWNVEKHRNTNRLQRLNAAFQRAHPDHDDGAVHLLACLGQRLHERVGNAVHHPDEEHDRTGVLVGGEALHGAADHRCVLQHVAGDI